MTEMMLLIDGVKYKLWTPKDEEKEFHPMIKEHSKEIFGKVSLYFDVKHKLKSRSGIGSIPDAYVIKLSKPYKWYIVENELSTHPVYSHIVPQILKFISGIENLRSQREVRDALYKARAQVLNENWRSKQNFYDKKVLSKNDLARAFFLHACVFQGSKTVNSSNSC